MLKKGAPKSGSIAIVFAIIIAMLAVLFVSIKLFSSVAKTETYYVLNQDVPAQTLITEDMLTPVSTSAGSQPKNILSKADILEENYYTKIAFEAGEDGVPIPLTAVQKEGDTTTGLQNQIPEDWVVTSFSISSDKAVSGQLRTGDFFDMLVVTEQGTFTPFINTLVLDTTLNNQTVTSTDGNSTYTTETVQYVVGLPAPQAARLQHILGTFDNVVLDVSSEKAKQCKGVNIRDYDSTITWTGAPDDTLQLDKPFDSMSENKKLCSADSSKDSAAKGATDSSASQTASPKATEEAQSGE